MTLLHETFFQLTFQPTLIYIYIYIYNLSKCDLRVVCMVVRKHSLQSCSKTINKKNSFITEIYCSVNVGFLLIVWLVVLGNKTSIKTTEKKAIVTSSLISVAYFHIPTKW